LAVICGICKIRRETERSIASEWVSITELGEKIAEELQDDPTFIA
jgi:hypothetical protein